MKQFVELSYRNEGPNPKIHTIPQEKFKQLLVDFPQPLAERMVELGFGKWIATTSTTSVLAPIGVMPPEQLLFVRLKTHRVKAVHVHSLIANADEIPEGWNKAIPSDLEKFAYILEQDVNYVADPRDELEPEFYDEDELAEAIDDALLAADQEGDLGGADAELLEQVIAEDIEENPEDVKEVVKEAPKKAEPAKKPAPKKK